MTARQLKRARSQKDKQTRRNALLEGAASLLAEAEFSTIRMEDIARAAGVSKGTLYLYFSQREEMFLTLAYESLVSWLEDVESTLRGDLSVRGAPQLALVFSGALTANPQLTRLLPLIPALQGGSGSEGPAEAQAAVELCSRRVDKLVLERLYAPQGGDRTNPVALAIAVLSGLAQVPTLGMSLYGYSNDGHGPLPFKELQRLLTVVFRELA